MFDRMRAEGLEPEVTAGHRTREQQQGIMDGKVTEFLEQGMNGREAWHYRSVGRDAAQAMKRSGQCLEEYVRSSSD